MLLVLEIVLIFALACLVLLTVPRWMNGRARVRRTMQRMAALNAIEWEDGNPSLASLNQIVTALTDIIGAEIDYYSSRRDQASMATVLRFLAWLLGTMGLICPLLAPMFEDGTGKAGAVDFMGRSVPLASAGYIFIALAAAAIAANHVLGLTQGHIRFVTAQLELERLLAELNFEWVALKARRKDDAFSADDLKAAFRLFGKIRDAVYADMIEETQLWAEQTVEHEAAQKQQFSGASK